MEKKSLLKTLNSTKKANVITAGKKIAAGKVVPGKAAPAKVLAGKPAPAKVLTGKIALRKMTPAS